MNYACDMFFQPKNARGEKRRSRRKIDKAKFYYTEERFPSKKRNEWKKEAREKVEEEFSGDEGKTFLHNASALNHLKHSPKQQRTLFIFLGAENKLARMCLSERVHAMMLMLRMEGK